MSTSFDASDLTAYIGNIGRQSDAVIKKGTDLPKAIKAQIDTIEVDDPEVQGDLTRVKTELNGQAKTLGAMYEALGERVGVVGDHVKTFMDRMIAATGDGVSKLGGGDVYTVDSAKAQSSLTDGLGLSKPAPKGPPTK
ncbi:hypothetical protein [Gordonia sihwensis]|uniref:hypothetical protein n=1 Tax=Gordonia sihwensis TaxID=173559 RepID=UPI003D955DDE